MPTIVLVYAVCWLMSMLMSMWIHSESGLLIFLSGNSDNYNEMENNHKVKISVTRHKTTAKTCTTTTQTENNKETQKD